VHNQDKVYDQLTSLLLARGLVNDCRVFQASKIKHADTTILTTADKDINTLGAKPNIVNLFIVGNKLGLGGE
jgi:hypothetical protein